MAAGALVLKVTIGFSCSPSGSFSKSALQANKHNINKNIKIKEFNQMFSCAYFLIALTEVKELSKSKQVPDFRIGA